MIPKDYYFASPGNFKWHFKEMFTLVSLVLHFLFSPFLPIKSFSVESHAPIFQAVACDFYYITQKKAKVVGKFLPLGKALLVFPTTQKHRDMSVILGSGIWGYK